MRDYILWLLDEEETEEEGETAALPSLSEEETDAGRRRRAAPLLALEEPDKTQRQEVPFAQSALAARLQQAAYADAKETSAQPWRASAKARLPEAAAFWGEERKAAAAPSSSLLAATQAKRRLAEYAQPRQAVTSPLLAQEDMRQEENGGLDVLAFDRAIERDARRYDKGFSLF